eukprot:756670-Hanusia_phi.AAC.6
MTSLGGLSSVISRLVRGDIPSVCLLNVSSGGSAIVASAPSWAMQRAWYLIWLYYALTDPHGVLRAVGARLEGISPVLSMLMMSPVSKSAGKVVVATCCLVLQFALDICCYDLLPHLNKVLHLPCCLYPYATAVFRHFLEGDCTAQDG